MAAAHHGPGAQYSPDRDVNLRNDDSTAEGGALDGSHATTGSYGDADSTAEPFDDNHPSNAPKQEPIDIDEINNTVNERMDTDELIDVAEIKTEPDSLEHLAVGKSPIKRRKQGVTQIGTEQLRKDWKGPTTRHAARLASKVSISSASVDSDETAEGIGTQRRSKRIACKEVLRQKEEHDSMVESNRQDWTRKHLKGAKDKQKNQKP